MLIYAGVGLLQDSYCIALISLIGYGSVGSWYNMKLEEKELLARFGEEYLQYKEEVPFLIPRFFQWNSLKSWMEKRNKDKG
jgi:protein-S-isoprenylcysteine O-methyltransferase Ste14